MEQTLRHNRNVQKIQRYRLRVRAVAKRFELENVTLIVVYIFLGCRFAIEKERK